MTRLGRLLCAIGWHRWAWARTQSVQFRNPARPPGTYDTKYRCRRCGKEVWR